MEIFINCAIKTLIFLIPVSGNKYLMAYLFFLEGVFIRNTLV